MEIEQFEQLSDLEKRELIFAEWIENLRDPERNQVRRHLEVLSLDQELRGQCCLGILCEIGWKYGLLDRITHADTWTDPETDLTYETRLRGYYRSADKNYDKVDIKYFEQSRLPVEFKEFLKLNKILGYSEDHYLYGHPNVLTYEDWLVDLNDNKHISFSAIANFVETNVMPKVLTNDE